MGACCSKKPRNSLYEYDQKPRKKKKNSISGRDGPELTEEEENDLADFLEDIVEQAELRLSIALNTPEGKAIIQAEVEAADKTEDEIKESMHAVVRKK
eukprot:CAMPEP_0195522310 /NCGR_PEP_ID=MMETSP0794_2-20130614/20353_1 /TAXON_ID=515487 /ORGANISM="Stephanopyxis turris, Strain CCMP 815" /LENGTH=97 /DNA_ID=CAMNT_0040652033 /DNA_START=136 /DNA_END=426 /DNA_ORIENTATION=+